MIDGAKGRGEPLLLWASDPVYYSKEMTQIMAEFFYFNNKTGQGMSGSSLPPFPIFLQLGQENPTPFCCLCLSAEACMQ